MFPLHEEGRLKQFSVFPLGTIDRVHLSAGSCWLMTLTLIVDWNGHLRMASYIPGIRASKTETLLPAATSHPNGNSLTYKEYPRDPVIIIGLQKSVGTVSFFGLIFSALFPASKILLKPLSFQTADLSRPHSRLFIRSSKGRENCSSGSFFSSIFQSIRFDA